MVRQSSRLNSGATIIALITVLCLAHRAPGQVSGDATTSAGKSGELDEIVVTAQRYSEKLESVPIAVSSFSAENLDQRQITNLKDAEAQIPGILITTTTGVSDGARIFLRGVGQDNAGLLYDPAVGVYVDGVYYPRINGALFDFFDVDRLEVLRGPQGTLYGRNTSAGAIKIETKNPTFGAVASGDFAYGNYNELEGRGFVSTGLIDDILAVSISGLAHTRDGITSAPAYGRDVNDKETYAGRLKLLYTPTDTLEVLASIDFEKDKSDPFIGTELEVNPASLDPLAVPGRNLYQTELKGNFFNRLYSRGIALNIKYALSDTITLNSISGYRELSDHAIIPLELLAKNALATEYFINENSSSEELNTTIDMGALKGVAGLYWFREFGTDHQGPDPAEFVTPSNRERATQSAAAYGQGTYEVYDGISLTGGLRYTYERTDFLQYYPTLLTYGQPGGKNWYSFTPKAGVDWQITDGLLAYFSYTKGFKSGGWNAISPLQNSRPLPYNPEKVNSYEIGAKFETDDHEFRVNTALFRAEYDSLQLPVFFPGTTNSYTSNTGGARVQGIEIEPNWQITPELNLYSSTSFQTGHYTSPFLCSNSANAIVDCENKQIKNLIPVKASVGATFAPNLPIPGQVRIGGEWDHTNAYWNNVSNSNSLEQTPTTDLFNAFVSYETEDGHWTLTVEGKNITNVLYYPTILEISSKVRPTAVAYPADPATYDVRVKFNFGGAAPPASSSPAPYTPPPVQPLAAPKPPKSYLVFFDFNKSDLTPTAVSVVGKAAENSKTPGVTRIDVTGHTDTVGSAAYNMRLSRRRAESVAAQLEMDGVPSSEIAIFAKGKTDLLVPTADGVKEPQNRRVEIVYGGAGS